VKYLRSKKSIWGDKAKKDSLDNVSSADKKTLKVSRLRNRRVSNSSAIVKTRRQNTSSSSTGNARVTVRRQRH
jgi:hypothetical protein